MNQISLRNACVDDVASLCALRNHYIAHSNSTFDELPLDERAVRAWLDGFSSAGPHRLIVVEVGQQLAGFCSSRPYRQHTAFRHTVETSIYLTSSSVGVGIGTALYRELFNLLESEELHRAVAGIAKPNDASIALHRKFGFREVGTFSEYAVKNGGYISSTWMEKALGG